MFESNQGSARKLGLNVWALTADAIDRAPSSDDRHIKHGEEGWVSTLNLTALPGGGMLGKYRSFSTQLPGADWDRNVGSASCRRISSGRGIACAERVITPWICASSVVESTKTLPRCPDPTWGAEAVGCEMN
jgi:hypothetical protein